VNLACRLINFATSGRQLIKMTSVAMAMASQIEREPDRTIAAEAAMEAPRSAHRHRDCSVKAPASDAVPARQATVAKTSALPAPPSGRPSVRKYWAKASAAAPNPATIAARAAAFATSFFHAIVKRE